MKNLHQTKYTCACCGYKTLLRNEYDEICPICLWEQIYIPKNDLFGLDNASVITLYEAQENYKKIGCSRNETLSHCRKPFGNEKKDKSWLSIQDEIENKYKDVSAIIKEIKKLSESLKQPESVITHYSHFKCLNEPEIARDWMDYRGIIPIDELKDQLLLKCLLLIITKKDATLLMQLLAEYYEKGLRYYIVWSIIIFVLNQVKQSSLNTGITDILLDIENNNYFGLKSLEVAIKEYWHICNT